MKNDKPLPSLFAKGKNRKKKQTKKEKIFSIVGIAVAAAALLTAFGMVTYSVIRAQQNGKEIEGYWYNESRSACWRFEDRQMYVYAASGAGYTLQGSSSYKIDSDKHKLTVHRSGTPATFAYDVTGDDLTIVENDGTKYSMHRGEAFDKK